MKFTDTCAIKRCKNGNLKNNKILQFDRVAIMYN